MKKKRAEHTGETNLLDLGLERGEFDIHCPTCGAWVYAYHVEVEKNDTCCLDCQTGIAITFDDDGKQLVLKINDGREWTFKEENGGTSGVKAHPK